MYRDTLVVEPDGGEAGSVLPEGSPAQVRPEVSPKPSSEERPGRAEFRIGDSRVITTVTAIEDLLERQKGVEPVQANAVTERVTVDYIPGLEALAEFHRLGIEAAMMTGDNWGVARAVAEELGIDTVLAEVLPAHKGVLSFRLSTARNRHAAARNQMAFAEALAS